jgi:hypothetical protein
MTQTMKKTLRERYSGAVACKAGCGRYTINGFGICAACRREVADIDRDNRLLALEREAERRTADDELRAEVMNGGVGIGAGGGKHAWAGV